MFEELSGARLKRGAVWGFVVGGLGLILSVVPAILSFDETVGLGLLFAARGPVEPPADVVLVNISRDSAAGVGQSEEIDEWPRSLHAALVDSLSAAGAEAIAFDIIFEEPRPDDAALAAAMRRAGNVILAERLVTEDLGASGGVRAVVDTRRQPVAELKEAARATAPFTLPKVPIRVGQFWTFGRAAGETPSLPAMALQLYLLEHYDELTALLGTVRPALLGAIPKSRAEITATRDLGGLMRMMRGEFQRDPALAPALLAALADQPDGPGADAVRVMIDLYNGSNSRYLNFYGPPRTIRTIPYDLASTSPSTLDVEGKVVFVGFAETRQAEEQDYFYSVFSQNSGANLGGVEIGASAFANLLERRTLAPLAMPTHLLLVLGWGLVLGVLVVASSTRTALLLAALAAALYAAAAYWAFARHAVWLPVLVPLFVQVPAAALGAVCLNYVRVMRQRERVQVALGYYVPRAVVNRLAEQSVSEAANRQLLHGTCLFTDAEAYTTVSEALRPQDLAALMNDYYRVMFGVVERHGGMVSDTAGDSMVALWATARPDADSRTRACRAALEILDAVAEFNRGRGGTQLPTRVGLESGEVLLGNIGAEQRFGYRAIGDIVNTAARLQGLNTLLGTRVLVSDATAVGTPGLVTRNLGMFLLRGKKTPIRVHEAAGFADARRGLTEPLAASFAAALEQFERERWADAERAFADVLARFPGDGPSAFYAGLSADYRNQPRPWTGAISVAVK